jgi:FkbH-like protein
MTDTMPRAADPRQALAAELKPADYRRIARDVRAAASIPGTTPVKLAVLSSFTADFMEPYVVVEALRRGYKAALTFGAFGQFEQELENADSGIWAFEPDALLLAMRPEDVDVEAVERFSATAGARFASLAETMLERLVTCAKQARTRMRGPILVANFATPAFVPLGPFDASTVDSLTHAYALLNKRLAERLAEIAGAVVWDYAGLVRSRGTAGWTDPRLWVLARAPVAAEHQPALAAHLARTLVGTLRPASKCLVLDLDNTIWGGVIGDDGPGGIQLGDDYPGSVYKQFQRAALSLMDRGVLLAVCSKNDHDVVEQTFRTHPEMVLKWDDMSCVRANWRSKSENLREIAKELNIGIDSLVLFDDNPVERAEVRAGAPEVGVVEVPTDPLKYVQALHDCGFFDQAASSAEDRGRAAMYRQERERKAMEAEAGTPEDFLRSLAMEAEVNVADEHTLGRITQLIGKTNQFNLTTRRHTAADVAAMASSPDHVVAWLRVRDKFGDQGLICVGVVRKEGTNADIDTFLMSCRVMNRRVEHAFMSFLLERARAMGCTTATGDYLPTKKNSMVKDFYPEMGFTVAESLPDGGVRYTLDLRSGDVAWPDVITRK